MKKSLKNIVLCMAVSASVLVSGNAIKNTNYIHAEENNNLISEGGHINVEGQGARLSEDGKSVIYSYIIAFQRMHSSDHGQTVSDVTIRFAPIPNAKINLTLIGTRDENGKPVKANLPLKGLKMDDPSLDDPDDIDLPSAEEVAAGKKGYYLLGYNYDDQKYITTLGVFHNVNGSQAVKLEISVPLEQAKKIKYLPIDARMVWKASQEDGVPGYESGAQSLEEYHNHVLGLPSEKEDEEGTPIPNYGGIGDPTLVTEEYVKNGHLIKSVANPSTYITPNNGDWTNIPEDTNIKEDTFFHYSKIFTLRANRAVTYYVSEKEDMADQDVSALYLGKVDVDYVIQGTNTKIKETYNDTKETPIYGENGKLIKYNAAENENERPAKITYDGKEYEYVGVSATSAPESGNLKEGTTNVVFEYKLVEKTPEPQPEPRKPEDPKPEPQKPVEKEQNGQLPKTGIANSSALLSVATVLTGAMGIVISSKKRK